MNYLQNPEFNEDCVRRATPESLYMLSTRVLEIYENKFQGLFFITIFYAYAGAERQEGDYYG